jgi:hypothetical protein
VAGFGRRAEHDEIEVKPGNVAADLGADSGKVRQRRCQRAERSGIARAQKLCADIEDVEPRPDQGRDDNMRIVLCDQVDVQRAVAGADGGRFAQVRQCRDHVGGNLDQQNAAVAGIATTKKSGACVAPAAICHRRSFCHVQMPHALPP